MYVTLNLLDSHALLICALISSQSTVREVMLKLASLVQRENLEQRCQPIVKGERDISLLA